MHSRSSLPDGLGTVSMEPSDPVPAGEFGTWTVTHEVGALGIDDGGAIKLAIHQTSDWGTPQFEDPTAPNYATVQTSGDASLSARFESMGHVRPYRYAVIATVEDGALAPGETITITLGDTGGGSPGQRAQTFAESGLRFPFLVDPHKSGQFVELPNSPSLDIVPGSVDSLDVVAPSTARPAEEIEIGVRATDSWGNVATDADGSVTITSQKFSTLAQELDLEDGIGSTTVSLPAAGTYRFVAEDQSRRLSARSNPCRCRPEAKPLYWGDLHGQSRETVGHRTAAEYFEHLSDCAFLDFGSHTANDFQLTDDFWSELHELVAAHHDPGSFVTFLGYEWSATTGLGGDHNVYFRDGTGSIHRSSEWLVGDGGDPTVGTRPIEALYDRFADREDVLIIPHQGGRPARLDAVDPEQTPFIEIASVWGRFEWFAREAMDRGLPVGFVGGSDDHCGRPGTAPPDRLPKHNVPGGLMGVRADALTREELWHAFETRRVYATSGARILLDVFVNGAPMGSETTIDGAVSTEVSVAGTAPVQDITLFRGSEPIETSRFSDGPECLEIRWRGQREPKRARNKVLVWDGTLNVAQGRIESVEPFGFERPEQGVVERDEQTVRWIGATTGNEQGLRLDIEDYEKGSVTVETDQASISASFVDLGRRQKSVEGIDAELIVERRNRSQSLDVQQAFEDRPPEPGIWPYFVRVRQVDGELAWSSPVFVRNQ